MWECANKYKVIKLIYYISFICCLFLYHDAGAQKNIRYDSSRIEVRHFIYGQISKYRDQKEFDYREHNLKSKSLWDRFWSWFWEQFYQLSQKKSFQRGFEIFIWIFSISLIIFAIFRLSGMEKRFFLKGNANNRPLKFSEEQEDIHSIDFSRAIEEAAGSGQYRLAVRLMYLQSLKGLSDRNLINFMPNKTNFDYARELASISREKGFEDITLLYEYAWYGEFPVNRELFERMRTIFADYDKSIRS